MLQSVHNYDLKLELDAMGWELEPYVYEQDRSVRRADFNKGVGAAKVVIEAEFGNASRTDSAQVKFQTAYLNNALKLAIMIVATNKMAKLTDSGLTTFEQTRAYFSGLHPAMVAYPLVVIGLEFDESTTVLDWSKSQFSDAECLSGNSGCNNIVHALSEYKAGVVLETIGAPQGIELEQAKSLRAYLNKPSKTGACSVTAMQDESADEDTGTAPYEGKTWFSAVLSSVTAGLRRAGQALKFKTSKRKGLPTPLASSN